jgi:hypothetical protein
MDRLELDVENACRVVEDGSVRLAHFLLIARPITGRAKVRLAVLQKIREALQVQMVVVDEAMRAAADWGYDGRETGKSRKGQALDSAS